MRLTNKIPSIPRESSKDPFDVDMDKFFEDNNEIKTSIGAVGSFDSDELVPIVSFFDLNEEGDDYVEEEFIETNN